jgi:opacity protein-like surface antigen
MSHHKTATLIALALGILPVAAAQAGEANFAGPSIGLRVSAVNNEADYEILGVAGSTSQNDTAFDLTAGYGFNLGKDWVLNVGASYTVNDTDFGTTTYQDSGTQTVSAKLKDQWSVSIEPGYRFAPQWLVYASLSYHSAEGEINDSQSDTITVDVDGFGYGLGLGYALNRNIEVAAEVKQIDFSDNDAETTQFGLRLNYRF